jgi:hypothetical protein
MSTIVELEKQILALSPAAREQFAILAWESRVSDPKAEGNREIDPEDVHLASQRNADVESGKVETIDHTEFLRRIGDMSERSSTITR